MFEISGVDGESTRADFAASVRRALRCGLVDVCQASWEVSSLEIRASKDFR